METATNMHMSAASWAMGSAAYLPWTAPAASLNEAVDVLHTAPVMCTSKVVNVCGPVTA